MKIRVYNDNKECTITSEEYLHKNKDVSFLMDKSLNDFSIIETDEKYKLHLNVLPHPYFGNIVNPDILIIAKNPSYAENEDEQDTYLYLKNHSNALDNYFEELSKVDFFESWSKKENQSFFNAWNWWNKKVIQGVKLKDESKTIGIINLCGYHSRYFTKKHYENFPFKTEEELVELINNAKLVIFVWEGALLSKIKEKMKNTNYIILNQCKNGKYGTNINSLKKIVSGEYDYIYQEQSRIIKEFFK
ncbi:MAG: hypothetical protein K6G28_06340 [Acholeplasmatales bacterium]|nr:hypothetical protein [Acholeplasmatales bacterium]